MIWIFDMHTRRSCSKMLWVSFAVCLQENLKKAEKFGFVSSVMELDHCHTLKRYRCVKGNLVSLNGFSVLHLFF